MSERGVIGIGEDRLMDEMKLVEQQLDALYHSVGFPRDDFDNGVARGLGLALSAIRKTTLAHELKRSLDRLGELEMYGQAPWQLTARAT